jgi:tripartite-type tricarboxylate transporter receptor subunit TctC
MTRFIAQRLSQEWRTPVVVVNKPGASETLAAEYLVKEPADGYTVGFFSSAIAINESASPQRRYTAADVIPVAKLADMPFVLAVRAEHPSKDLADFVKMAKANPGKFTYGHLGVGGPHYLTMEWFKKSAGIDLLAVPYRGTPSAVTALISGEVDAMVVAGSSTPLIKAGKLRALAAMANRRPTAFPDLPTLNELGYGGFNLVPWCAAFMRIGTPPAIINKVVEAIGRVANSREFKARLVPIGADASYLDPTAFEKLFRGDIRAWGSVLQASASQPQ